MSRARVFVVLLAFASTSGTSGQRSTTARNVESRSANDILVPGRSWELLGEGFHLTADSAVDEHGNVYFTDSRNNRILKIDSEGKISDWKQGSNGAHGIAFGPDGRLYAGQHDLKRVVAFTSNGTESVITEGVQSHHLTITAGNRVYLTEPPAHRVWLVLPDGNRRVVHQGLNWPRGVRPAADQSSLLVNDPPTPWVWSFPVQKDGSLSTGRRFCRLQTRDAKSGTDAGGMTVDSDGSLYVATDTGVQICNTRGRLTGIIDSPEGHGLTNVFFAGPELAWLYVTDGSKIYRRFVARRGALPWKTAT